MKMIYGGVPVKALNINYFEQDTNDCDMIASDLQAGKTAVARGQKITGTGKSFEFAYYGQFETNDSMIIPTNINVVEIASLLYPIQLTVPLGSMKDLDFSSQQSIGNVVIDGISYPITIFVESNEIFVTCEHSFRLQIFFGKDNYV